jgi:nucleoside phosphorylase
VETRKVRLGGADSFSASWEPLHLTWFPPQPPRQLSSSSFSSLPLNPPPRPWQKTRPFGLGVLEMPTYDEYRIGWICALPIECAAVESMLDASHPTLPNRENDGNTYIFGEINGHNIVIACLPYGVYGTTSASLVATNMRISFPSVRFCLIVGIAGGAPSPQYDIRLGDVVVSKPIAGYGGVIQYDYGKAVDGGELVPTGYLDKPPAALLTAIARLQSSHQLLGNNIPHLYEEASRKYPRVRDHFKRPETADDLLFRTEYGHVATWNQDRCEQCDPNMLQKRSLRCSNHPHVFYGLIASANQLLRDAVKRDNLAQRYGILCFEMESAGIMDVFPCLVIRGISDYCDSHKNKRWQGYASISAAAYAKELLSVIPSVNLTSPSVVSLSTSDLPTPTISTPELPTPILSDEPDRSRKLERRNTPRSKSLEPQEKDKSTSDQLRLPDPPVSNRSQSAERPKKETTEHNKLRQPIPRIVTESDSRTQSKENEGSRRAEVQIPRSATSSRPRETAKEDSDTSKTRPGSGARETIHAETPVVANKETNGGRKDKTSTTRAATRPVPIPSISGDHGRSPVTEPEKIAKPKPPKTTKEDAHGQSRRPDEQLNTAIPTSGKDHDKSKSPTKPVLNSPSFKRSNSSRSKDQKADDRSQPIIDTRETSEARPKGRSRSKSQEPPAEKRSSRDRPSLEAQETSRPKLSESPVEKSGRSDQHLLKPKDALRPRSLSAHSRPPDTTGEDRKQASQHLSAPPSIGRSRSIGHAQSGPRKGLDKESVGIKTSQSPQSRAITRAQRDIIEACMVQWGLQVPQSSLKSNTGDILVVGITLGTKYGLKIHIILAY